MILRDFALLALGVTLGALSTRDSPEPPPPEPAVCVGVDDCRRDRPFDVNVRVERYDGRTATLEGVVVQCRASGMPSSSRPLLTSPEVSR